MLGNTFYRLYFVIRIFVSHWAGNCDVPKLRVGTYIKIKREPVGFLRAPFRVLSPGLERIPIIRDGGECLCLALCARRVRTPAEDPGLLRLKPGPGARREPAGAPRV